MELESDVSNSNSVGGRYNLEQQWEKFPRSDNPTLGEYDQSDPKVFTPLAPCSPPPTSVAGHAHDDWVGCCVFVYGKRGR